MLWKLSRKERLQLAALVPFLLLGSMLASRLSITVTPSLDHRVFFLRPVPDRPDRIDRGDYLIFSHRGERLLKIVGCAAGDRLDITDAGVFCNGGLIASPALSTDSHGNPMPQFRFHGVVPAGLMFMIGQHPRSYDSRYLGFIDAGTVLNLAYPIF